MVHIQSKILGLLFAGMATYSLACGGSRSCGSDRDCNQEKGEICESHVCVSYQPKTATPQQVFDGWADAFARGDLEGSLNYWSPGLREICRGWFTNQERLIQRGILPEAGLNEAEVLPYLARQFQGATLVPREVKGDYLEYSLDKECTVKEECPKRRECLEGKCSGEQLIIFDKLYDIEGKQDVFKIRSF